MKRFAMWFMEKVVFRILGILIPPKKGMMLFGSGFGHFSDNPKFLYLYFNGKSSLDPIWISGDRAEVRRLRKKGYSCLYRWSLSALWAVIRAPFFFISHNVKDIYPIVPRRSIVINLWHGTPIKHIGFDSLKEQVWIANLIRAGRPLPYERWDYFVAASPNTVFIFEGAMRLPKSKILPLGQPRTEHILAIMGDTGLKENLDSRLALSRPLERSTLLLYTPTFRSNETATRTIKQTLNELDRILNKTLDKIILFKPHPLDKNVFDEAFFKSMNKVVNVSSQDTQELLGIADVLITDYSSILFDFMITGKPIIAYIFDKETYIAENGGLYFSFEDLVINLAHDSPELINLVMASENLKKAYDSKRFNMSNSCLEIERFVGQLKK